jgi:hypothetical protein
MGKRIVIAVAVTALVMGVPIAVLAASGGGKGALDHQRFKFREGDITTTSQGFHDVLGLSGILVCAKAGVSVSVSATVRGGPVALRVKIDDGPTMHPGQARFDPGVGTSSFAYTWVNQVGTFEGSDGHAFDVQWRSATGAPVTMDRATVDILFQDGRCP